MASVSVDPWLRRVFPGAQPLVAIPTEEVAAFLEALVDSPRPRLVAGEVGPTAPSRGRRLYLVDSDGSSYPAPTLGRRIGEAQVRAYFGLEPGLQEGPLLTRGLGLLYGLTVLGGFEVHLLSLCPSAVLPEATLFLPARACFPRGEEPRLLERWWIGAGEGRELGGHRTRPGRN